MPPGPVFHLCAIQQVHAVCCLHNQVILNIPHLILVNNLWGRHFTQLQTHSSLFSLEKHVSTGGSGPKRAALTGSQTEDWTPQRLFELFDISGCDFLTVFRSQFKPKEQWHPSPSTVHWDGVRRYCSDTVSRLTQGIAHIIQQHPLYAEYYSVQVIGDDRCSAQNRNPSAANTGEWVKQTNHK